MKTILKACALAALPELSGAELPSDIQVFPPRQERRVHAARLS